MKRYRIFFKLWKRIYRLKQTGIEDPFNYGKVVKILFSVRD